MCTRIYEESFGRIGRQQPVAVTGCSERGYGRERDASATGQGQSGIELHAAARADRSRRIGELVAFSFRFIADKARRLIAGPQQSINFQAFQPKE